MRGGAFKFRLLIGVIIVAFAFVKKCSNKTINPYTNRSQNINMDPQQEIAIGIQSAPQIAQQHGGLHNDVKLQAVIDNYLKLVYQLASIRMIEISTAFAFTNKQKNELIKKLKELTKAREIRLIINIDSSLIGGFLIKTNSKVIDFTVKNQLQKLANHLDTVLEI